MKSLACVVVCLVLASSVAYAQGVGSSGEITGTVTDSSGGVVLKDTATVVDTQTGAIILRLPCSRPGSPIPPAWRETRISESSKHRKAGCLSTAAMAGETA